MRTNPLGATGLRVSEVGLGTARIGGVFNAATMEDSITLIRQALDNGVTLIDTANIYAQGDAEKAIGRAISGRRNEIVVCTKAGFGLSGPNRVVPAVKSKVKPILRALGIRRGMVPGVLRGGVAQDFAPDALCRSTEASLRRLGLDYVDVLLLHSPPLEVLWLAETRAALRAIRSGGLARVVGVSLGDDSIDFQIPEEVQVVQAPVNALTPAQFLETLDELSQRGVGIVGRQCFASGRLSSGAGVDEYAPDAMLVQQMRLKAAARGESIAETAFREVHGRFGVACTLVGAHQPSHIASVVRWIGQTPHCG
jgi:aryl-alcohol dehydrogenase-like predicted oxidoreductase